MCPFKRSSKGFGTIQVCFDNFVSKFAMLGRIAAQGANLELAATLEGTYYCASLLPRGADHGNYFAICTSHLCASAEHYIPLNREPRHRDRGTRPHDWRTLQRTETTIHIRIQGR